MEPEYSLPEKLNDLEGAYRELKERVDTLSKGICSLQREVTDLVLESDDFRLEFIAEIQSLKSELAIIRSEVFCQTLDKIDAKILPGPGGSGLVVEKEVIVPPSLGDAPDPAPKDQAKPCLWCNGLGYVKDHILLTSKMCGHCLGHGK